MKIRNLLSTLSLAVTVAVAGGARLSGQAAGQAAGQPALPKASTPTFDKAAASLLEDLKASTAKLANFHESIRPERSALNNRLAALEAELAASRSSYQEALSEAGQGDLTVSTLETEIKNLRGQADSISNLLAEYTREFEAGAHIAELQRYRREIDAAKRAIDSGSMTDDERFDAQVQLVKASIERLIDGLGGTRFAGQAVDSSGLITDGTFLLVGHSAIFRSANGAEVGTVESKLNSMEPTVRAFPQEEDGAAAAALVEEGSGDFPFDPTGGSAHEMAKAETTLVDEFEKGGPIMWPILIMAGLAALLAIYKGLSMMFLRRPSRKQITSLLDAVRRRDPEEAMVRARATSKPVQAMLVVGVDNIEQPRELMEESMYESVLKTRFQLNSLLPFIAICAASAPLLGLLGTVSGIINTFKLIAVYGSSDVKSLSGGISEALITTKYGLIVAIPSLLLHAYLSRKAKGIVGGMETVAVAFINEVSKAFGTFSRPVAAEPTADAALGHVGNAGNSRELDPLLVRAQVTDILRDLLGPELGPAVPANSDSNAV